MIYLSLFIFPLNSVSVISFVTGLITGAIVGLKHQAQHHAHHLVDGVIRHVTPPLRSFSPFSSHHHSRNQVFPFPFNDDHDDHNCCRDQQSPTTTVAAISTETASDEALDIASTPVFSLPTSSSTSNSSGGSNGGGDDDDDDSGSANGCESTHQSQLSSPTHPFPSGLFLSPSPPPFLSPPSSTSTTVHSNLINNSLHHAPIHPSHHLHHPSSSSAISGCGVGNHFQFSHSSSDEYLPPLSPVSTVRLLLGHLLNGDTPRPPSRLSSVPTTTTSSSLLSDNNLSSSHSTLSSTVVPVGSPSQIVTNTNTTIIKQHFIPPSASLKAASSSSPTSSPSHSPHHQSVWKVKSPVRSFSDVVTGITSSSSSSKTVMTPKSTSSNQIHEYTSIAKRIFPPSPLIKSSLEPPFPSSSSFSSLFNGNQQHQDRHEDERDQDQDEYQQQEQEGQNQFVVQSHQSQQQQQQQGGLEITRKDESGWKEKRKKTKKRVNHRPPVCTRCKAHGIRDKHFIRNCPFPCSLCGLTGHTESECPTKQLLISQGF